MNEFLLYLGKSSLVMAVMYLFYSVLLKGDTHFKWNRVYLLLSMLLSLILPLIQIEFLKPVAIPQMSVLLAPFTVNHEYARLIQPSFSLSEQFIFFLYLLGVTFFLVRFFGNIRYLIRLIRNGERKTIHGLNVVYVNKPISPFSFFNLVLLPRNMNELEHDMILQHEKTHVIQLHSFDLICFELLGILLWFNPFVYLMRRSMKSIHEFLADQGVVTSGQEVVHYQQLLFTHISGLNQNQFSLTNNFNYSMLKNRIIMMTKKRSNPISKGKYILVLPMIAFFIVFFSTSGIQSVVGQEKAKTTTPAPKSGEQKEVFTVVEEMPTFPGGDEALGKFLGENIHYPDSAIAKHIQGNVFVQFVVNKDGAVGDVKILRGIGGGCDEEALRVIKLMPRWNPGKQRGEPVAVQFNLPIRFALDKKKSKQ